jgi:hypothetical protein
MVMPYGLISLICNFASDNTVWNCCLFLKFQTYKIYLNSLLYPASEDYK